MSHIRSLCDDVDNDDDDDISHLYVTSSSMIDNVVFIHVTIFHATVNCRLPPYDE